MMLTIIDILSEEVEETSSGFNATSSCPCCGENGTSNYKFSITQDGLIGFCHQSRKWFNTLETLALKHHIINCRDGRGKGQKESCLDEEQWKEATRLMIENFGRTM